MSHIRWYWKYIKKSKWAFVGACIIMILEIIAATSKIGLQKWLIDSVFTQGNYQLLPRLLLLITIAYLLGAVTPYWSEWVLHKIGYAVRVNVGEVLMEALYRMPLSQFQNERITRYVDYFTNDLELIGENVYRMPLTLQDLLKLIVLVGIMAYLSPSILLIVTVMIILYFIIGKGYKERMKVKSIEVKESRTNLLVHIEEGISSTREVIAYNRMDWEEKIYHRLFKKYYIKILEEVRIINEQLFLTAPLRWGTNLIVLIYGGYLVLHSQMTLGTYLILYQYSSNMAASLQAVYDFHVRWTSFEVSIERVRSVIESAQKDTGKKSIDQIDNIVFDNVSFQYSGNSPKVLDELSLSIPIGKKVAIVGASGSGKSTIARLLIRFFQPTDGTIRFNGTDIYEMREDEYDSCYNIAFQEPYFFPDTIRNNILFGRMGISDEKMVKICRLAQIHEDIMKLDLGYDAVIGERGISLSGGQKQRLSLARALAADSEILILDEATSALDLETERQIQKNMDELRQGKTTIIIAHRLSTVQNADKIYVFDNGRVAEAGSHKELMQNGSVYASLVHAQTEM
ncbi:ABC transporter ATP-binding protein [Clostridium boliviensis]|uniref:ABC transporter ATP-binding protein n=1 Tax=Clostridium boliviensis TaxID=318465 RepID=A0ABU4GT56_9CLOT|nr:ABC transporter ATP-binding protein [Clostridium boliviensis]MDW2800823.1 ABC transporter ATP-binding protein [Clostridium boliviensis]